MIDPEMMIVDDASAISNWEEKDKKKKKATSLYWTLRSTCMQDYGKILPPMACSSVKFAIRGSSVLSHGAAPIPDKLDSAWGAGSMVPCRCLIVIN